MNELAEWVVTVFSQAPDDVVFLYSAVPVSFWGIFWPPYRHRIVNTLHSLHGGDADAVAIRRSRLATQLKALDFTNEEELWKAGLLVHALGDSFAHTYVKNGEVHAFNELYGHAFATLSGKDPDVINDDNMSRYRDYLFALYASLDRESSDSALRRQTFEKWACELEGGPSSIGREKLQKQERELVDVLPFSVFNDFLTTMAVTLENPPTPNEVQVAQQVYSAGTSSRICTARLQ